jgi:pimeloyl-ACP methyl ester carboxylesterase
MIAGFTSHTVAVGNGIEIAAWTGGSGPPLLLLHGYPQTSACWRKVAPGLAERFTVVAADLRGYGQSSKPPGGGRQENYAKRAMAGDQVALMRSLGFERFRLVGHDRGGRVAHRLALDHPHAVERLSVLDICPTAAMYAATDKAFASAYYHWFFLIQPADFPERMIANNTRYFLRTTLAAWCKTEGATTRKRCSIRLRFTRPAKTIARRRASTSTTMRRATRRGKDFRCRCWLYGDRAGQLENYSTCWRRGGRSPPRPSPGTRSTAATSSPRKRPTAR